MPQIWFEVQETDKYELQLGGLKFLASTVLENCLFIILSFQTVIYNPYYVFI